MPISHNKLESIAALANISLNTMSVAQLSDDVTAILTFVAKLHVVDTQEVEPLLHPLDVHQRLREDICDDESHVQELEQIAPAFKYGHYLVPKVIDVG